MKSRRQSAATVLAAVLVVLVTGIAVTVYHLVAIRRLEASAEQTQYQLIASIQQAVDTQLRSIDNSLLALAFSQHAQSYMDDSVSGTLTAIESLQGVQRQLFGIRAINEGVLSAWAVSFARGAVLTDATSSPLETFPDRAWIRTISFPPRDFRAVERRLQVHPREVTPPETSDVLSIVRPYPVLWRGGPFQRGLFIANLDLRFLARLCDLSAESPGLSVVVSDRQGGLILASPGPRSDDDVAPIVASASTLGQVRLPAVEFDGHSVVLVHRPSEFADWVYTLVAPVAYVRTQSRVVTTTQIAILVLLGLMGMVTAVGVMRWSFRPVNRFVENVDTRLAGTARTDDGLPGGSAAQPDDLGRIESAVARMIEDNEAMRQRIEQNAPVVRWQMLMEFLMSGTGRMPWPKQQAALRDLGVDLHDGAFQVLVVEPDTDTANRPTFFPSLCEAAGAIALNVGKGVAIEIWNRRIALIVSYSEPPQDADLRAIALAEELLGYAESTFDTSISVGSSSLQLTPGGVADAYREALHALNHRLVLGRGSITTHGEVDASFDPETARLYGDIDRLLRALGRLPAGEIPGAAREWFARAVERGADHATLERLSVHILMAASGRAADAGVDVQELAAPIATGSTDELVALVGSRLERLARAQQDGRSAGRSANVASLARRIVTERYHDPALSLSSVADEIGISQSHLSRVFHEATGTRFVDHLIGTRMERARELLCGDDTVQQVATRVGYSNTHSFLRIFKRWNGLTPSEYRASLSRSSDIKS